MPETSITRTPNLIAAEINSIKNQTKKMLIYNSIEIGRRLTEAKELIKHGEWSNWLKESVDYSQRTANNLMKIFDEYGADQITLLGDNTKSQAFANLGYSQAVALLEVPEEEREKFIEENNIDEMSTRELQQAIKDKKEAEEKLKEAEKRIEDEHKAWENVSNNYKELEKSNKKQGEQAKKLKEELKETKDKNKEDITNKEVEIENLKIYIQEAEKKIEDAKASGNTEEVEKLQTELQSKENSLFEANKKIEELQEQLKEKPVDVNETIIEKIPEEVEKELKDLREKANKTSEPVIKFSIQFEGIVKGFNELLGTLQEIENEELRNKYKGAASKLINKMNENL